MIRPFPSTDVRARFPILQRTVNGCPLVYCDSAATSLTPIDVLDAEANFYRTIGANVHRGSHTLAVEASEAYERARKQVASFIGALDNEIVFTSNATAAINTVAAGLPLRAEDETVASINEHHSALLPFMRRGGLRMFEATPTQPLEPDAVFSHFTSRTKVLVVSHASNVTGVVNPVQAICQGARERGVVTLVDASQSAGHSRLDVNALGCDFLAFSGHKLLGPTGIGVLYGRSEALATLTPRDVGGGAVHHVTRTGFRWNNPPANLEAGTPNIAGAIGLAEATRFLERLGWDSIETHHRSLLNAAWSRLSELPEVVLLGSHRASSLPTISMSFPGVPMNVDTFGATLSDRYGIMVRSGLHCAHPMFEGLQLRDGVLRASLYVYNTLAEVEHLCASLREILRAFR